MAQRSTDARTANWLWFVAVLFAWPVAIQLVGLLSAVFESIGVPRLGSIGLDVVVLMLVAWASARLVFVHGAPPLIWLSMLMGSLPYAALALVALVAAHALGDGLGILAAVLLPPAVVIMENRRRETTSETATAL